MEPANIRFGGGSATTMLHPLVAVLIALAVVAILCLPRKYVVVVLLLTIFTIPAGQVVVLAGIHFTVARILILVVLTRCLASGEWLPPGWLADGYGSLDCAFTLWALVYLIGFSLLWMETQALIKALGQCLDCLGGYCVLRWLIRDKQDLHRVIKILGIISVVLGLCMVGEQVTHQNIFGLVGGIPSVPASRDGGIRSQGVFEVYITAGVFGASLVPLFIYLWSDRKSRLIATLGLGGATVMTIASNSSTPLLAFAGGLVGLAFWPMRRHMRAFRWLFGLTLVGLHIVMKAPVWALISHVDLTGSSSGYHRYMLVDNLIRHFSEWWLIGYKNYQEWGWDMWDLSNQYVACALTGGLATLATFILIISRSFSLLGKARRLVDGDGESEWLLWCLGAASLSHVVAYFGIAYFDQMQFAWYALLAMIVTAAADARRSCEPHAENDDAAVYDVDPTANWEMAETI